MVLGHAVQGGGAEPAIVLHEWLGDSANWDLMRPYLDGERFTWVFADLRGYGRSRTIAGAHTVEEAAGDVLALADALGFERFHLVGHSMSGMIGQYLACKAPERVKALVAVCPVPASGFPADAAAKARMAAVLDDDEALREAIGLRTGHRYTPGWVEFKLGIARRAATRAAQLGCLDMFTGTDVSAEVAGLPTPILALLGAHDLPLYREASVRERFGAWYPNLEVAVCQEAGHYPMLECPPLTAALIQRFVAGLA
ncbi:MAG TPA: alpha/beta hydrolase [Azospirillum sp.]|nr:alpha/beta hydrolase [Azospirillum sp.]